jgi:hypothetical protein
MAAKYQTKFELNRSDLDVIEQALRDQASKLCLTRLEEQDAADNSNELTTRMSDIQSVLGKLHNQKIWFVPKDLVPLG